MYVVDRDGDERHSQAGKKNRAHRKPPSSGRSQMQCLLLSKGSILGNDQGKSLANHAIYCAVDDAQDVHDRLIPMVGS